MNIQNLFSKLAIMSGIEDIGYHKIESGKLVPIAKTNTGKITEEDWKAQHHANPVIIENDLQLRKLMETKKSVFIKDCAIDSTKALDSFAVHSMYTYPVIKNKDVIGIIVMVSIGEKKELTDEIILQCEQLINLYSEGMQ